MEITCCFNKFNLISTKNYSYYDDNAFTRNSHNLAFS